MPNLFNFNPKTQGYINNALDTLTLWFGGNPKPRNNQNQVEDPNDPNYTPYNPPQSGGGNTLLYVVLGVAGASLVTYLLVKKNQKNL